MQELTIKYIGMVATTNLPSSCFTISSCNYLWSGVIYRVGTMGSNQIHNNFFRKEALHCLHIMMVGTEAYHYLNS
jgi:hypothetical protein